MGFFLTTPFDVKPSDLLQADLGHTQLKDCEIWFPMLEEAGGVTRNAIYPESGTLYNSPTWKPGHGLEFNGSNQYLEIAGRYNPASTDGPFSLSCWLYGNSFNNDPLSYGDSPVGTPWSVFRREGTTFRLYLPDVFRDFDTLRSGWNHILISYTDKDNVVVWQNGVRHTTTATQVLPAQGPQLLLGRHLGSYSNAHVKDARVYRKAVSDGHALDIYRNPWAPFERHIWVPTAPPTSFELNIDGLNHARPLDQVDLSLLATLIPIDSLRHSRRVDSFNLGVSVDLFIAGLRHDRLIDAVDIDVSVSLVIDALRHGRFVDIVDIQELVGVLLNIGEARHARPVDSLLLDIDQSIVVDNIRHGRPVDAAGVQPLLGDQTGIGATASHWVLDAGQPLNNATLVDFDYHVLEGVFDSDQSVLSIDGTRVIGPAGMRELTALTLGANVDGQERVQGEIAELRIYAGALSQADRDRILQELEQKWITG